MIDTKRIFQDMYPNLKLGKENKLVINPLFPEKTLLIDESGTYTNEWLETFWVYEV